MLTRGDEESVAREEFDSLALVDRVAEENVALLARQRPLLEQLDVALRGGDQPKYLREKVLD